MESQKPRDFGFARVALAVPKVGSVSLSPRGDWRMPSDAEVSAWLAEFEEK